MPAANPAAKPATTAKSIPPPVGQAAGQTAIVPPIVEGPILEDWWLVRDAQGRCGWMLARGVDVDVPDEIGLFAEGQRYVGAYVFSKVYDEAVTTPDHMVAQYVTVLSPPKNGLPFDFDQVRVFTWSIRRHRYETAFRLHPIQGYLPVRVTPATANTPASFSFQIADGLNMSVDPATGISRPATPRTITYQMDDTRAKRIGTDQGPIPVSHLAESQPKTVKAKPAKKTHK
jgi:hypothetical protein